MNGKEAAEPQVVSHIGTNDNDGLGCLSETELTMVGTVCLSGGSSASKEVVSKTKEKAEMAGDGVKTLGKALSVSPGREQMRS